MRRALVIVNPAAGEQAPLRAAASVERLLGAEGWEVRVEPTSRTGHATELARRRGDADRLVVVGGDGTLRETLLGLDGDVTPVGLVPIGKANVVARELHIPRTPASAIRLLVRGQSRPIDVGTVGDTLFLAMVGIGYDGLVTEGVRRLRESRAGGFVYARGGASAVYAAAGLPALLRMGGPCLTVELDGDQLPVRYRHAIVSNTETYATGWAMTPGADPADGLLDHQLNRRAAPWFLLWMLGASALRRRLPAFVADYGRGRSYVVRGSAPFAWQIDGDSMPRTSRLEIGILPGAARLIVGDG